MERQWPSLVALFLYYKDALHMNDSGYKKLGELQVAFLAFPC